MHRTLGNLAADADGQIAYLREIFEKVYFGPDDHIPADELALEFGDMYRGVASPERSRRLGLSPGAVEKLAEIDAKLASISGAANAELWLGRALRESPHWREVRERATVCQALLPRAEPID